MTGQRRRRAPRQRPRDGERAAHDLAGAGASHVGVEGALRARDVNRPDANDLAAAEHEVTIVRKYWKPPT